MSHSDNWYFVLFNSFFPNTIPLFNKVWGAGGLGI